MSTSKATIRTVASRAKVSIATVSRVLNDSGNVKPELKKAVEDAARELGYSMRAMPRRQKPKALKIGLLLPPINDSFYPSVVEGILDAALGKNVETTLCDSRRDQKWESHHINSLLEWGVDGIITTAISKSLNPLLIKQIEDGFPLVFLLDREVDRKDLNTVSTDNVEGAYHAAKYLLDLGHRDILCLCLPDLWSVSAWRRRGVANALADAGLPRDGNLFQVCDIGYIDAYEKTTVLVKKGLHFTAICALSDSMAIGALRALEDLGYRVPDDCSIIGYDDLPISSLSLTTVAEPRFEIGKNAMTLLLDLIAGRREPPQKIVLRNSLIIRRSCRRV